MSSAGIRRTGQGGKVGEGVEGASTRILASTHLTITDGWGVATGKSGGKGGRGGERSVGCRRGEEKAKARKRGGAVAQGQAL